MGSAVGVTVRETGTDLGTGSRAGLEPGAGQSTELSQKPKSKAKAKGTERRN